MPRHTQDLDKNTNVYLYMYIILYNLWAQLNKAQLLSKKPKNGNRSLPLALTRLTANCAPSVPPHSSLRRRPRSPAPARLCIRPPALRLSGVRRPPQLWQGQPGRPLAGRRDAAPAPGAPTTARRSQRPWRLPAPPSACSLQD